MIRHGVEATEIIQDVRVTFSELIKYIQKGEIKKLEELLKKDETLINGKDLEYGCNLLHWACIHEQFEIIKLLIGFKVDLFALSDQNRNCLHQACRYGSNEVVDFLVKQSIKLLNQQDNEGATPLHLAVREGKDLIVQSLALIPALDKELRNKEGKTALHIALEKEYLELAKTLIMNGANVNSAMPNDITLLHIAVDKNDPKFNKFILFLLEHGADPNRKRSDSKNHPTVLHSLVSAVSPKILLIQDLLKYGACPFVKNALGHTVMNMVFKDRALFVLVLNSTKFVYIESSEIDDDIIFNKLVTSLLYKLKRHEWNSKVCDNIRHCLILFSPENERCTEKDFRDYIEDQETRKKTFFGSYFSDGDKSDSDEESGYKKEGRQTRVSIESSALKNLKYSKVKLLGDRQQIHHENVLDKKVLKDLEILNKLVKKGVPVSEVLKQIDTKFYVAQYRGIGYFTNKWNQVARRSHRRSNEINKPQYSASVLFGASNTHSFSEFYKSKSNLTEQQVVKLENDIIKWGNILKEKVLSLRNTEKYIYNEYTYDNLAELLQDVYTKSYTRFEKLLKESAFTKHYLLNEHMPFVSTGDVPYHALKYAYGTKYYNRSKEDKNYKEERLRPRWQRNGKAERPYSGKVYISLHPLEDFNESGPLHLVSLNTKGKVNIDNLTIPERESTFPAFLPENRVFFQHIAKYPSFHKPYKDIFLDKYGLTREKYENFQREFYAARPHTPEMKSFKEALGDHLCAYYEVKLIEIARKKVESSKKEDGLDGILIYRDAHGFFGLELPPDTVMRNNKKVVAGQRTITKSSREYRESLASDEIALVKKGITRPPKKDYDPPFKHFQYVDFDVFRKKVLGGNVRKVEALCFPDFYIHQTFTPDGGKGLTTMLHEAVIANAIGMVKYLLGKGALCNIRDVDGNTPLHLAVNHNNKEIIQLLVRYDADSGILNNENQTPKDVALTKERLDLICCMLKHQEKDELIESLLKKDVDQKNLIDFFMSKKIEKRQSINVRSSGVNIAYQYEDNDIQAILAARLQQLRVQNAEFFTKPIEMLAAIDNIMSTQLEKRLRQETIKHQGARIVLIPCNLGNAHWVGILLEFNADGQVSRAEYIDSNNPNPIIPNTFQEQLQNVYSNAPLMQPRALLQQKDDTSCGAYTIENLLIAALDIKSSEEGETIRSQHLEALRQYNPDFYRVFNERQKNNRPSTASLHEQLMYLDRLKNIWFSKQELNRILAIKKCFSNLAEKPRTVLLEAFKPNPADNDEHSLHLKAIRMALQAEIAKGESKTLAELMELLFEACWQPGISLDKLKFRVGYEEILAITQRHLEPSQITDLQQTLAEQIKQDEEFALKLQAELWSHDETQTTNNTPQIPEAQIKEFLRLVAEGEQDKAEEMLNGNETKGIKRNPALALLSGNVTDLSGRTFIGITAFQYAVWALDWHMWTMIRKYLPDEAARKQAECFETGSWVKNHGVHAKRLLDNLEKAYQTTIELNNGSEADNAWIQQVGGAQRLLPAHVVNEYCHPTHKFNFVPDFNELPFPRSRIMSGGEWFTAGDGKLGEKFAVHRGDHPMGVMVDKCLGMDFHEYYAIRDLSSMRTAQREKLITELRRGVTERATGRNDCILTNSNSCEKNETPESGINPSVEACFQTPFSSVNQRVALSKKGGDNVKKTATFVPTCNLTANVSTSGQDFKGPFSGKLAAMQGALTELQSAVLGPIPSSLDPLVFSTRASSHPASISGRTVGLEVNPKDIQTLPNNVTGVNVNTPSNGAALVFIAAQNGDVEAVDVLKAAGVDLNTPDARGATPIYIAAQNGHAGMVSALIRAGADASTPDERGATPVFIAAQEGHAGAVAAERMRA